MGCGRMVLQYSSPRSSSQSVMCWSRNCNRAASSPGVGLQYSSIVYSSSCGLHSWMSVMCKAESFVSGRRLVQKLNFLRHEERLSKFDFLDLLRANRVRRCSEDLIFVQISIV